MHRSFAPLIAVLAAGVALLVALAPLDAFGAPLAATYADLRTEVQTRLDQLPETGLAKDQKKQKSALTKARAALDHDGATLSVTVADAGKVIGALDPVFPGDPTFGPHLDTVLTDLRSSVVTRIDDLSRRVAPLLETDKTRTKVQGLAAQANAALVPGDAAGATRPIRAKSLAKSLSQVVKADKLIAKAFAPGGARVKAPSFAADVDGDPVVLSTAPGSFVVLYDDQPGGFLTVRAKATTTDGVLHNIFVSVPGPARGLRAVRAGTPYTSSTQLMPLPSSSGTVRITSWNPASLEVAGTFDVTYSDGTTTVQITDGKFATNAMQQL
jgi:hypothetical protein